MIQYTFLWNSANISSRSVSCSFCVGWKHILVFVTGKQRKWYRLHHTTLIQPISSRGPLSSCTELGEGEGQGKWGKGEGGSGSASSRARARTIILDSMHCREGDMAKKQPKRRKCKEQTLKKFYDQAKAKGCSVSAWQVGNISFCMTGG